MPTLTCKAVLNVLMKDPEYAAQPESVRRELEPIILALPEILKSELDKLVTLQSVMEAKLAFIRYYLKNDNAGTVIDDTEEEEDSDDFFGFSAESIADMMRSAMEMAVEMLASAIEDIPGLLKAQGVNEDQMMAHPRGIALKPALLKQYRAGTLTIGDLLLKQPMVIVKNT